MWPPRPTRAAARRRSVGCALARGLTVAVALVIAVQACSGTQGTARDGGAGESTAPGAAVDDDGSPLRRVATDAEPLRASIVGDSVALTAAPAIATALESLGVERVDSPNMARLGFAFTSDLAARYRGEIIDPAFPDWRSDLDRLVTEADPDVVVTLVGAWDVVDRRVDGRWLAPGTPEWSQWYAGVLDDAVDRMTANGAFVTWIGMPCIATEDADRVDAVNAEYRALAQRRPDEVAYVDLEAMVCPGGEYEPSLPGPDGTQLRIRDDDGVHFEFYQVALVLSEPLRDAFAAAWGT